MEQLLIRVNISFICQSSPTPFIPLLLSPPRLILKTCHRVRGAPSVNEVNGWIRDG
ncbi:hypothetical protein EGR_09958 [Echinococcus granulosus]|uniref:Uncharacterized protein n=1 Tax=Echinococcus granulosus TaxID=6210 RepID=W6U3M3_ECHGR|nr:hypothetical protein EGR_09958 [Echinococcus granulosus]EUB55176.1 hypothetical protein EGR_09958 [Echinococcus granulosus]